MDMDGGTRGAETWEVIKSHSSLRCQATIPQGHKVRSRWCRIELTRATRQIAPISNLSGWVRVCFGTAPQTIGSLWSATINNNNNCGGSGNSSCDPDYEIIGPGVFRFEYYYILKNGRATDVPWNTDAGHTSTAGIGLGDIEAIGVTIAVIDSTARALIDAANSGSLLALANDFADFKTSHGRGVGQSTRYIGELEANWETTLETVASTGQTSTGLPIPPEAAKAIRIYGRSFDLKSLSTF